MGTPPGWRSCRSMQRRIAASSTSRPESFCCCFCCCCCWPRAAAAAAATPPLRSTPPLLLLAASADGPIVLTAAGTRPLLLLLPLALLLEGEGPPRELAEMICDRTLGPPAGRCRMAIAPAKGSGLRPPSARALRGSSLPKGGGGDVRLSGGRGPLAPAGCPITFTDRADNSPPLQGGCALLRGRTLSASPSSTPTRTTGWPLRADVRQLTCGCAASSSPCGPLWAGFGGRVQQSAASLSPLTGGVN
jgi:hypothetical protein